jgi:creatinine amidohydrolase/Fe(II)-dependent formamide hydrolase-like protein
MRLILIALCSFAWAANAHAAPPSVFLEELTWIELRDAQRAGKTTVIIPVGGTEQSGPHLVLGKHNVRVKLLAGRIAEALGNAVVAPVVAYVPEGNIAPPSSHMRFSGTISIPDATFKSLLDATARGFKQHGFTEVVLIGDHGGYQSLLKAVALKLNQDWAGTPARAHFIDEYYRVTQTAYVKSLQAKGLSDAQIGVHAGAADTALQMAADPGGVRADQLALAAREGPALGVTGDPRNASAALGQTGLELIVSHTVAAIRLAVAPRH